jgi:ArsR family transcriptional regulator, arsenate/arsenite/antimonite-responsive transcriptional repressor
MNIYVGDLNIFVNPYILFPVMPRKPKPFSIELFFRTLADPTRLRILNLLADREICVCYFVQILGISQPKISRHLAYLRRQGMVAVRRDGKWMHYRLQFPSDEVGAAILRGTLKNLKRSPELADDIAKLGSACCQPEIFRLPQEAPQPSRTLPAR